MGSVKSLDSLYDYIKEFGETSQRKLASIYKTSHSSIGRRIRRIKSRSHINGSVFFETEDGQKWLIRMVVACILVFGIVCNVGAERISMFFSLLTVTAFAGLSSRSIARIESRIDDAIEEYRSIHDDRIKTSAKDIDIIVGADETFFENMMILVMMELRSGFIFSEKAAEDRTYKTWDKFSMPWLSKFKSIYCMVSDRAKALVKLANDSIKEVSVPDLFHLMQDTSNAVGRHISVRISAINKKILNNKKKNKKKKNLLEESKDKLFRLQQEYKKHYRKLSTSLHPFKILSTSYSSSKSALKDMSDSVNSIRAIGAQLSIANLDAGIIKVARQLPDATMQIDIWHNAVASSLDSGNLTEEQKNWLQNIYLPSVYWKKQIPKTDSKIIKRLYAASSYRAQKLCDEHSLTKQMLNKTDKSLWDDWANSMCCLFQRTSSAIEGRNGWLAQMHFCGRGISEKRLRSQTTIHNYFLKRQNGTTACERLSGIKPDCLFEFILKKIDKLSDSRVKRIDST